MREDWDEPLGIAFFGKDPQPHALRHSALVRRVTPNGLAAQVLQKGDQILGVNGTAVTGPQHALSLLSMSDGLITLRILPKRYDFDLNARRYEVQRRIQEGMPPPPPGLPAAACMNIEALRKALFKGADVNAFSTDSTTRLPPLVYAISSGSSECVQLLLAVRANPNVSMGYSQCTMLHFVCKDEPHEATLAMTVMLIAAGARVNTVDVDGRTPLHYAATYGREDTATLLLDAGAEVDAVAATATALQRIKYAPGHRVAVFTGIGKRMTRLRRGILAGSR